MTREAIVTESIVLRTVPYGDADLILTLFTRERGRLSALARSARKSRKRFGGCLQLFTLSTMQMTSKGGELWTLSSAQVSRSFADLALDVGCFAHASYGTELVRELTAPEQSEQDVLELLLGLYEELSAGGPSPAVLRCFELRLLGLVGLAPVLDRCVSCGSHAVDEPGVVIDPSRGGVCCPQCAALSREVGVRPISGPARRVLSTMQAAPSLAAARSRESGGGDAAEARDALLALILGHIGKPLRTVEFIAKVSGAARQFRSKS